MVKLLEHEDWLWVYYGDPSSFTDLAWSWGSDRLAVRFMRGKKMSSTQRLFDEWAAALQFPYYFGENWAAFDECVADLSWIITAQGFVLAILDADQILLDDDDFRRLLESLGRAVTEWSHPTEFHPARAFKVVLQCTRSSLLDERLARLGFSKPREIGH